MAKATAEEAARTRQKIIDAAVEITLTKGFESVTLGVLAKYIGMSRSGINAHFPRKENIAETIRPVIAKVLFDNLDFSSCDVFYSSWVNSINTNPRFCAAVLSLGPIVPPDRGFDGLVNHIQCDDKDLVYKTIYQAVGYAVFHAHKTIHQ